MHQGSTLPPPPVAAHLPPPPAASQLPPPPAPGRRGYSRTALVVLAIAGLIGGIGGVKLGLHLGQTQTVGIATEITVDGDKSGVYRLAVGAPNVNELAADASIRPVVEHSGPFTVDQATSEFGGWTASCALWTSIGVIGTDQGLACATDSDRPNLGHSGPSMGPSAGLPHAIAFTDWHFDVLGDLRVAATGTIHNSTVQLEGDGVLRMSAHVGAIGAVPEKSAAAAAAGVDVLVVPSEQASEFADQQVLDDAGVEVIGVPTLHAAIWELCSRSQTQVCRERVLPVE